MTGRGMPRWAHALNRAFWTAIPDADDGRGVPLNRVINVHKGLTGPLVLGLMLAFGVFTTPAWIYLALHGSYGVAWVIKDRTFPDGQWQRRVRASGALATWGFLTLYWAAPVILVLGTAGVIETGGWDPVGAPGLAGAIALYAIGLVLMIGADAQKNITLRERSERRARWDGSGGAGDPPGAGLITSGFYARTRHPNYLGEMMIYGAFALVVGHWLLGVILAGVWLFFFLPNVLAIDASLARYREFPAWKARTGLVLPTLFRSDRAP